MAMPEFWTPARVRLFEKLQSQFGSDAGAVAEFEKMTGRSVTPNQYRAAKSRINRSGFDWSAPLEPDWNAPLEPKWKDPEEPSSPPTEADPSTDEVWDVKQELQQHHQREEDSELRKRNRKLLEELASREKQIALIEDMRCVPPVAPIIAREGRGEGKQRQATAVMLCSDWHVEEPVVPEKTLGLNRYNLEIAEKCIERLAESFCWLAKDPRFDVRTALVWLGGDLFSGYIHDELMETCFLSPTLATLWLMPRIEAMLRRILVEGDFERLIVPCNDGNHGRTTKRMRISTRTENSYEWWMYKELAYRLRDEPRIQFQIAEGEETIVDIYGKNYCFFHGDSVNYQGGIGGLLIPMRKRLDKIGKYRPIHHFAFGHFHQRLDFPTISGNGSMIGPTPYSLHIAAEPEPRQQSFFFVDSVRGKTMSCPIWL